MTTTSYLTKTKGQKKTQNQKKQHASACIQETRWSCCQANDGISKPILTQNRCGSADCYDGQLRSRWLSVPAVIVLGAETTSNNDNWLIWVMVYCKGIIYVNEWVLCSALWNRLFMVLSLTTSSLSGAARCSSSRKSRGRSLRVRTLGGVFSDRVSRGVDWIRSRSLGLGNWGSSLSPDKERCEIEFQIRDWCIFYFTQFKQR